MFFFLIEILDKTCATINYCKYFVFILYNGVCIFRFFIIKKIIENKKKTKKTKRKGKKTLKVSGCNY